ncbi:hypothetical protein BDY24DRAFT_386407 [Mrakia frigida]|uniref:She4p n=1 Tax=Mrakia frigida TaxID=29902 RepID=UPI003FCC0168
MPSIEEIFDDPVVPSPSPSAPPPPPPPSLVEPPTEASLQALLTRVGSSNTPLSLLPPDLLLLISSFTHDIPARTRSLGFLILAQLNSSTSPSSTEDGKALGDAFAPKVEKLLLETKSEELEKALSFLSALLQSAQGAGISILLRPGFMDNLFDLTDLYPSSTSSSKGSNLIPLALADLISQASNTKPGRTALSSSSWIAWLERQTSRTDDPALRATAAVALTKLSRGGGSAEDVLAAAEGGDAGAEKLEEDESEKGRRDLKLASMMKEIVTSHRPSTTPASPSSTILSAVEGLAFTSLRGPIKELLANDKLFLQKLFSLVPPPPTSRSFTNPISISDAPPPPSSSSSTVTPPSLAYGIAAIISNLVSYRPQLTAEQAQLDRLRRMTTAAKKAKSPNGMEVPDQDPLDDDRRVRMRVKKVLEAGGVPVLVSLSRSESRAVRDVVGRCFLALVEVRDDRGLVIQQGGAKALLSLIHSSISTPTSSSKPTQLPSPTVVPDALLPSLQALSKLTITTSPFALFGLNPSSSADAVRPIALLLLHEESSLLQKFEALMALTNLASLGPELADRIALAEEGKVVRKTEELMLEDNKMVKRAATELVCNLLSSDRVFEAFSGEESTTSSTGAILPAPPPPYNPTTTTSESKPETKTASSPAASKLHILLALSNTYDLPTRLASSACLATLTSSPIACSLLLSRPGGKGKVFELILDLFKPVVDEEDEEAIEEGIEGEVDVGLVHRGALVLRNVLGNLGGEKGVKEAGREAGGKKVLEGLVEGKGKVGGGEVEELVRECLSLLG